MISLRGERKRDAEIDEVDKLALPSQTAADYKLLHQIGDLHDDKY